MKNKLIYLSLTFLLAWTTVFAQTPKVELLTDKTDAFVGDRINITLKVTDSNKGDLKFKDLKPNFGNLDQVSETDWTIYDINGAKIYQKIYSLTYFDEGDFLIPSIEFTIQNASKNDLIVKTNDIKIKYSLVKVDTNKPFKTIADPKVQISKPDSGLTIYFIITGLAFIISVLAYFYTKRKKVVEVKPVVEQEEFFDKNALPYSILEKFKELEAKKLQEKGEIKEHFKIITDILREYVLTAFDIDARVLTGNEIYIELKRVISEEMCLEFKTIFETCDMVKYAPKIVVNKENTSIINSAQNFVVKSYQEFKRKNI